MDPRTFYLLLIPGMAILAFLIGAVISMAAMSARIEPADDEPAEGEAAH